MSRLMRELTVGVACKISDSHPEIQEVGGVNVVFSTKGRGLLPGGESER
jgi:hypothetical protein